MKLVHSILILMPLLGLSACKTKTTSDSSDTLTASKPESALNSHSSGLEFCDPNEGAGASSCEKVLQDFMNSPKYKGKELLISCGGQSAAFVYDADAGGGGTLKPETLARLLRLMGNPNTNANLRVKKSCGVREAS